MDAGEHTRRTQWSTYGWLTEHQLLDEQYWDEGRGARWVVGQPQTFIHRAEVIAGIGGSLLVHGDFDLCRFAHYGDHGDAWSRLLWMADCEDLGYYVAQKAAIGMAGLTNERGYDVDVAAHDLRQEYDEMGEDPEDPNPRLRELLLEAIDHTETEQDLRDFLYHGDEGWDLWERDYGRVTPGNVVVNHCLLQRTAWLLRLKYGAAGPPACRSEVAA